MCLLNPGVDVCWGVASLGGRIYSIIQPTNCDIHLLAVVGSGTEDDLFGFSLSSTTSELSGHLKYP